jgi:hypothetical protein
MPSKKQRLFHLMSQAQHRLVKSTDAAFNEALGVSHTQLGVLWMLEQNPRAMLKDVSNQLGINASAITGIWRLRRPTATGRSASLRDTALAAMSHALAEGDPLHDNWIGDETNAAAARTLRGG